MTTMTDAWHARVAAHPDRVALRGPGTVFSYTEADSRADGIAEQLRALGVGHGTPVGVLARRSVDLVVTLLGVLKAGAAYVPLDSRQPESWRTKALRSVDVRHVIDETGAPMSEGAAAGTVPYDSGTVTPSPADLAYIAFTSGSTGPPRGVAVSHEAVLRLARDPHCAPSGPGDRYLQFAPVAFDASTFEIWAPLLGGGELVVHPPEEPSPAELAAFISEQQISTLWLPAGLFHLMVDLHAEQLAGVRRLVVGGDVVSPRHAAEIMARFPGNRLVNGYGPTENTTFTCCHEVVPGAPGPVPIGRPVNGTGVRVLDDELKPASEGELYAVGCGLARGYAGEPGLTAARFVSDPWSEIPGGRMYRTGDRVRVRPDGVLEFLGRVDRQVKINGFRVEPGEVEATLSAVPAVRAVAVVPQRDRGGAQRLTAFVAPHRGQIVSVLGLRKAAVSELPEYAVPSSYRVLEDLPLTDNGKVDRSAMAALESRERPDLFTEYVAPQSSLEKQIAHLWSDLLGVDGIGCEDDFVSLGGYSLLSMRMTADLAAEFGVTISPREFYLRPTVAGLTALIEERAR